MKFAFTIQHDNDEDQKVKFQPSSTKNFDKMDLINSQTESKSNNKSKKKKATKETEKGKKDTKTDASKKTAEKAPPIINSEIKPTQEEEINLVSPEKITKPVFKYIPDDDLMKEMINKLIDEMMVHERRKRKKTTKKITVAPSMKLDTEENEETGPMTTMGGSQTFEFAEEAKKE